MFLAIRGLAASVGY